MASDSFRDLAKKYECFVEQNPEIIGDLESSFKWISYFIAGRFTSSPVISELLYSISNLLALLHDIIIKRKLNLLHNYGAFEHKLEVWLTTLEYIEVFVEITGRSIGGTTLHWVVVFAVLVIKTILKLLLFRKNCAVQRTPPIWLINRNTAVTLLKNQSGGDQELQEEPADLKPNGPKVTVTLRRSGRVIRTLETAPPVPKRNWKIPDVQEKEEPKILPPSPLSNQQMIGELLHIMRPIAQFLALMSCGRDSWKPWILSCGLDITSLRLLEDVSHFTTTEKAEINHRKLALLFYLLRSPFYDRFTRGKLISTLGFLSENVPLASIVCRPLMDYIPEWKKIYFYNWGS